MPDMILGTREVKIRTQIINTTINLSNYSLQKDGIVYSIMRNTTPP